MRLHHLEVTAFGPFADRTRIDFDTLSDAGLFLLSGPTGAGKSSILDAVCFALYGDVPGDRSTAKRLRSDHAGDDVVPRVVLEATLSGRRFRIDRSPAWVRPKKRGSGTTTEQARVVISERRPTAGSSGPDGGGGHQWHPLSTRLDETGHLVTRLVGMTLPQFCQVALLPQGRFQAFLRARSEDRHALLQQVFQTGRFDRTERWLRERRVELRRASDAHHRAVADLVSRVSEVGCDTSPDQWSVEPAVLDQWLDSLATSTAAEHDEQAATLEVLVADEREAAETLAAGTRLAGLQARRAAAERDRAALLTASDDHVRQRRRLDEAHRSAPVRPLHLLALDARRTVDDLDRRVDAARGALVDLLAEQAGPALPDDAGLLGDQPLDGLTIPAAPLDDQGVADLQREATRMLTDIARVRPLQHQALDLERQLVRVGRDRDQQVDDLLAVEVRLAQLPDVIEALGPALTRARAARARAETLALELGVLDERLAAARTAEELEVLVAAAERELREVQESRLIAREALVEIRERRLDGMAAEIACQLAVGASCPVCGSAQHPRPASPTPGAPDESAEREARRAVDDLEGVVEAHAQQVRGLATRLAASRAEAAAPVDQLLARTEEARGCLDQARGEADGLEDLTAREAQLRAEVQRLSATRHDLATAVAQHDTETAVLASRVDDLRTQVAAVAGEGADLDALARFHQEVERLTHDHRTVTADLARARATATQTQQAADETAMAAGFPSASAAAERWLTESEVDAAQAAVDRHDRELARVEEVLADPELAHATTSEPPDLDGLASAHAEVRQAAASAHQRTVGLRERASRLRALRDEVRAAVAAWAPVRDDLDLVADLASLVDGKHPDNRMQMRLSAYVLAHRLGQVVDAANLRLSTMSDQRYSLVHTGQRGAGETRGGLSLLVRDDWTGDSRDPATLSGGETFVVSLALALGLADVITQEAGGTDLDTLFVDEGFGSLDAETLEDVMDTLDSLRDGGRVVGVVSHVPELQTRIPTQLRVLRGRHGSRVALRLA
ncbi:AAA family ATPase [Nocardioides hwasunensis]|uniref:Nuclease SbcCD subunit C n=1 Tax=Nocardioides hwasunensis TaxID=397258 RepID=A0ABR8MI19_9ACTN|nr:SMC family ATPase [Nocardioides hwasunensis]MBD3914407.1 SMC family ATPase [Nocardioides hwasunensis]